ncbi:hypothetical protein DL93DRAFT_2077251 [Clavulina sp. PMI_390]|nr:hypothetical protein DL93DRAFT_2077251 [Clavulina sp. PMI_390]
MKGLSALERNKPTSRLQLTLRRLQGISMLIFYPLEFMSFFSAPWAPVLAPRWISFQTGNKAALWSIRAWLVYVAAQVALLLQEQHAIASKEASESEKSTAAEGEEARIQREKTAKRKEQIMYQLVANVSRLPVIVHWSVEGGVYPYEILTTVLSLISALAAFGGGWENTRLPPPTSR